jgi:tetratricopeptide (TPR) repeat protein
LTATPLNARIFISRTGADAPAAQWIASTLTQQGYDCVIQDRDFQIGASFPGAMREAFESCDTVLAVMSPNYWKSRFCLDEWDVGYALDRGGQGRLIPVMVSPSQPPKLAAKLAYLDLARMPDGTDKAAALVRAVDGVIKHQASLPDAMEPATIPLANDVFHTAHFTGREEELSALHTALWGETGAAALTPPATLTGLGGMGKSAIAREYARRHLHRYAGAWLVKAETDADRTEGFATLAIRFDPRLKDETNRPALAAHGAALAQRQAKLEGRPFLIVLDNIEKPVDVPDWARGEGLHTIITTRWSAWTNDVKAVEIERLPLEAARALMLETSGRTAGEGLETLLTALDGLPLGLVQSGSYLLENPSESYADYAAALTRRLSETPDNWPEDQKIAAATFWPSIEQAEEKAPGAFELLANAAFYAPDDIPLAILADDPSAEETRRAFDALLRYSLVRRGQVGHHGSSLSLHRLLQAVVGAQVLEATGENAPDILKASAHRLATRCPQNVRDVRVWPAIAPLAAHVAALSTATSDAVADSALTYVLNQTALFHKSRADWMTAEVLLRRLLRIRYARPDTDRRDMASSLNNLATLLQQTNRLAEAEQLHRDALEIREATLGPDHPDTGISLGNLAQLLVTLGRHQEVEPLRRRELAIMERSLPVGHPNVATALVNLAGFLRQTGRYGEAEPLYRRALAIDEAHYGPDHPEVATDLNNLAGLLQAIKKYDEAEIHFRRALAIHEASYGPNHPDVGIGLNNLAGLVMTLNQPVEAEALIRRALAIAEASLGPNHPDLAVSMNNFAGLLFQTGRLIEAIPFLKRAHEIFVASLPESHPHRIEAERILRQFEEFAAMGITGLADLEALVAAKKLSS